MKIYRAPLFIIALVTLFSCGNSYVLTPEQLEDVLVDIHLAEGMVLSQSARSARLEDKLDIYSTVYAKHGVDKARFDSSMVYYSENLSDLSEVYTRVYDRIEALESEVKQGDFAFTTSEVSQEVHDRILGQDMELLPFVQQEMWPAARAYKFKVSDYKQGKSYNIAIDTLAHGKMEMRYMLENDSLSSAQCVVTMHYVGEITEDEVFELSVDSARLVSHQWAVKDSLNKITVKFEAEPMNENALLDLKDVRLYELSPERHDILLFN